MAGSNFSPEMPINEIYGLNVSDEVAGINEANDPDIEDGECDTEALVKLLELGRKEYKSGKFGDAEDFLDDMDDAR